MQHFIGHFPVILIAALLIPAAFGQDAQQKPAEENPILPQSEDYNKYWSESAFEKPAKLESTGRGAPYPPFPPNAVMGQYSKTIDHYSNNPDLPEWLAPYTSVRLRGKGTLRLYGFAREDWSMATRRFQEIQFPQWVLPQDSAYHSANSKDPITVDDNFNYDLFAKVTRLGAEYFHKPDGLLEGGRAWARVEVDFLNNQSDTSDPTNQPSRPLLRLRLAHLGIGKGDWDLVMGQDWDLFSPLIPTVMQGTQMAYAGNTGDRRPSAYVSYDHDFGEGIRIQVQNGISLANAIDIADYNSDGQRGNSDYGLPGYQTRLGIVVPTEVDKQPLMIGISAVMADTHEAVGQGKRQALTFPQRGIAGDLRLPLNEYMVFQGEAYTGYDLNEWRGGVGQGINLEEGKVIQAAGGWWEIVTRTCEYHRFAVGMGVDKANGGDVPLHGRTRNLVSWARNEFMPGSGIVFGCEYFLWSTQYNGYEPGKASLINLFSQLNF